MNNVLNPKITMLTTRSSNSIAGRVVLNGQEWVVEPFEIKKGASAAERERTLIERAIKDSSGR